VAWEQPVVKRFKASLWIQGPLVAVVVGIVLNEVAEVVAPRWAIGASHLVQIPTADELGGLLASFTFPDFGQLANPAVYTTAVTLAVVASLETLLCVEATDKLDPQKRVTPTDRELKAQGLGNVISGLLGGLPVTQVIVRSSANIQSGARGKLSAILHGVLLLAAVVTIPALLNRIPLAVLAAILLLVGYKLAKPALFLQMYRQGPHQFVPFAVTVLAVVFTDLLKGVGIGLAVSVLFILTGNMKHAYHFKKEEHHEGETLRLELAQEVSFLNKAAIKRVLADIPANCRLIVDASKSVYIDYDVLEMLRDFLRTGSKDRGIEVRLIGFKKNYKVEDGVEVA
jgi:MFS superfamily sulfate permease-like transporter